ncbi:MAG TPA: protein translocase SEC61 complex subunit gamma [Candidatus Nanoarchaeia archaeon]|nr:protein translocase SEC61 complex subunit gamma [Candidatus Nanoarchaeia archaeon]
MEKINAKHSLKQKLSSFIVECKRVWQVTKKPTKDELKVIVKVTGMGILIIGLLGFIINIAWQLFLK